MLEILRRNGVIRPAKTALELAPETFNRIGVDLPFYVLAFGVLNLVVFVAHLLNRIVDSELVRHYRRAWLNVLSDQRNNRRKLHVPHNLSNSVAFPLDETDNGRFLVQRPALLAVSETANIGFVYFHHIRETLVRLSKQKANLFCHAPGRLVGNAKRSLQFLSGNSISRISEKEDGVEPAFKRGIRFVKDSSRQWVKLVRTVLAGVALPIRNFIEPGVVSFAGGTLCE